MRRCCLYTAQEGSSYFQTYEEPDFSWEARVDEELTVVYERWWGVRYQWEAWRWQRVVVYQ
jgi:hypothetical protein